MLSVLFIWLMSIFQAMKNIYNFFLFFVLLCNLDAKVFSPPFAIIKPKPSPPAISKDENTKFIIGGLKGGRLGNQFFFVAAALSLGMDHGIPVYFPEFVTRTDCQIPETAKRVFFRLNFSNPGTIRNVFNEKDDFTLVPIPLKPAMQTWGYFQSEKYFVHNWDKIAPFFEPSEEVKEYIANKYDYLLTDPFTVGIHIRDYKGERQELGNLYTILERPYFEKAANLFPPEALFVIFSDNMNYAKTVMQGFKRPHVFIEGEDFVTDFYLLSFLKHQIISNSTFSWWAAYMNKNPQKVVVAPTKWFKPAFGIKDNNINPKSWIKIK